MPDLDLIKQGEQGVRDGRGRFARAVPSPRKRGEGRVRGRLLHIPDINLPWVDDQTPRTTEFH
jgi:hypothetical protein